MIPSRPSRVDMSAAFSSHGPSMGGQPCVYNYPPHANGNSIQPSCGDMSNHETRVGGHSSEDSESKTSVSQRRMNPMYPEKFDGGYSFPVPRPYDPMPGPSSYCHSIGGHNEYLLDRSRLSTSSGSAPFATNAWKGTPQRIIPVRRVESFDRFNNGSFETKEYIDDFQVNHYLHPFKSHITYPPASRECEGPPNYHFMHRPYEGIYSKGFHIPSEDQAQYFHQMRQAAISTNDGSRKLSLASTDSNPEDSESVMKNRVKEEVAAIDERKGNVSSDTYPATTETLEIKKRPSMSKDEPSDWGCTCKRSKCLKLYCQCFGSGNICGSLCRCVTCLNKSEHEQYRSDAIKAVLSRNPNAFDKKNALQVEQGARSASLSNKSHSLACKCRKSACLKKYCECFNAEEKCNVTCRCLDCRNTPSNEASKAQGVCAVSSSNNKGNVGGTGNDRMMNAVQKLTLLKNTSPSRPDGTARSSPSLPSLLTMTSAISSKDDDDSTTGVHHMSSNMGVSLQGMDVLAMAALSELKYRAGDVSTRDDSSRPNMLRTSSTSTSSLSLEDVQINPSYHVKTLENRPSFEREGLPPKKRSFRDISSISDHNVYEKSDDSLTEDDTSELDPASTREQSKYHVSTNPRDHL